MSEKLPTPREGVQYDADSATYKAGFDAEDIAPSHAVVHAVAHVRDTDPLELTPLNDAIDAESLDAIVANTASKTAFGDPSVSFRYREYLVAVHSCGLIEVDPDVGDGSTEG